MIKKLKAFWQPVKFTLGLINLTRFSFLIVVLAAVALSWSGQFKDILVSSNDDGNFTYKILLIIAVSWWSLQSWGWARFILDHSFNESRGEPGYQRWLINHLPRIYGAGSILIAAKAAYAVDATGLSISLIILSVIIYAFYVSRRDIFRRVSFMQNSHFLHKRISYITFFIMGCLSIYAVVSPVSMGFVMGSGAVVFFGLGSLIPIGTLLVHVCEEQKIPVISILVILVSVFSLFNDNHGVRLLENQNSVALTYPPVSLESSYASWEEVNRDNNDPLVLVAAAGGGLRATYWTAVVLGHLEDNSQQFHKKLFAISGVSGGSLAGVMYNAALRSTKGNADAKKFQGNLLSAMSKDFLAPTVTAMLYGDLMQRFLPLAIFSDRAQALEKGWESGFKSAYTEDSAFTLNKPFRELFVLAEEDQWLPNLLLNGTSQETGKRIITSSLTIDQNIFPDAYDFYKLNDGKAIAASTAAHNSARFTYVSPAGVINTDKHMSGHIIDGGYFENYGATTLSNLLAGLENTSFKDSKRGLLVIVISNDTAIQREFYTDTCLKDGCKIAEQVFLNEIFAPLYGMLNVRNAHGFYAFKDLNKQVKQFAANGRRSEFVHFSIKEQDADNPPLGWVLSKKSMQNMKNQITSVDFNQNAMNTVCELIKCN